MQPKFETWWWLPVRNKKIPFATPGVKNGAFFNMEKGKFYQIIATYLCRLGKPPKMVVSFGEVSTKYPLKSSGLAIIVLCPGIMDLEIRLGHRIKSNSIASSTNRAVSKKKQNNNRIK